MAGMASQAAVERHHRGYNCSQSVACALGECLDVDGRQLFMLSEGLGRGVGTMDGTCGALLGACMVAGLTTSDGSLDAPASKLATYELTTRIHEGFVRACGSSVCRELRGEDTGTPLCSCDDCIAHAARIAEEALC